jgi:hypothetical protein
VNDVPPAPKQSFKLREYWIWLILPFAGLTVYFFIFWMLMFANAKVIPFTDFYLATLPSVIFAALTTYVMLRLGAWLYLHLRRFKQGLVYFAATVGVALWIGWVLFPVICDSHESFEDVPNKRCECRGVTVHFYPGSTSDGSDDEVCIGAEIS